MHKLLQALIKRPLLIIMWVNGVALLAPQTPPPTHTLAGLFDLAVCERLLLEPSAWGEGGSKGDARVCDCVCVLPSEGRNDVTDPCCTIGPVDAS